jgi:NitT/TauT family transport system ATP-binding protein
VVFVSHDIEEAAKLGSRILVLSPHPGRVKATLEGHTDGIIEKMRELIFDNRSSTDTAEAH